MKKKNDEDLRLYITLLVYFIDHAIKSEDSRVFFSSIEVYLKVNVLLNLVYTQKNIIAD